LLCPLYVRYRTHGGAFRFLDDTNAGAMVTVDSFADDSAARCPGLLTAQDRRMDQRENLAPEREAKDSGADGGALDQHERHEARLRARPFSRVPRHIGVIPDGNRRWAEGRGSPRREGYASGVLPGVRLLDFCRELGLEELSIYGFTKENARRPPDQVQAFRNACVEFSRQAIDAGAALHVIGDSESSAFPAELRAYTTGRTAGEIRVNLLVNYGWQWDVATMQQTGDFASKLATRIDLVVRWGGRCRLSGFLPMQCAYADVHVIDTLWPAMRLEEFVAALHWYGDQDVTLGG
jgi:undecaprenyl diphosphate synthase